MKFSAAAKREATELPARALAQSQAALLRKIIIN
jgi:hypothetical protein